MCRFIESICCLSGQVRHIDLHQARVDLTFRDQLRGASPLELSKVIKKIPTTGKFKCRVEYGTGDFEVSYQPYTTPDIHTLRLVEDHDIDYQYKSTDRSDLDKLFSMRREADDIIIVKNGLLTDSYYANLAFFDGREWWTPERPLLVGTQRAWLLRSQEIKTAQLTPADLADFQKVSLINAMNDLGDVMIDMDKILA